MHSDCCVLGTVPAISQAWQLDCSVERFSGTTFPAGHAVQDVCDAWLRTTGYAGSTPFLDGGVYMGRAPALIRWLTAFLEHAVRTGDSSSQGNHYAVALANPGWALVDVAGTISLATIRLREEDVAVCCA